jgi:hypothetical protein
VPLVPLVKLEDEGGLSSTVPSGRSSFQTARSPLFWQSTEETLQDVDGVGSNGDGRVR